MTSTTTSASAPGPSSSDEQKVRDVIGTWGEASATGDLIALMDLMTEDAIFLTAGQPPMHRKEFAELFSSLAQTVVLSSRSNIQEISISGDIAVCWVLLEVDITPAAGGATIKRAGNTLTALRRSPDGKWRIWRDANLLSII